MSELTPNEIADYPLRTSVRGYRVEQVDELLDRVADRIESLQRELAEAREHVVAAERRADESSATESTLKRTLVTAQRAAEDTVAEAKAEAAAIRSDAEEQADRMLGAARAEAEDLRARAAELLRQAQQRGTDIRKEAEDDVARLREVAERFRTKLRQHLDTHAALLDRAPTPDEVGPATHDPAWSGPRGMPSPDPDDGPGRPGEETGSGEGSALFASNGPVAGPGDADGDFAR